MSKILMGIIVAMVLAFGTYYWLTEKRLATLTENNAKLSIAAQTNQQTIDLSLIHISEPTRPY